MTRILIFIILAFSVLGNKSRPLKSTKKAIESIQPFVIKDTEVLKHKFEKNEKDVFIILLTKDSKLSTDVIIGLQPLTFGLKDFNFSVFFCGEEKFCFSYFNFKNQPDIRFYPVATNPKRDFISHSISNVGTAESDVLKAFFSRHVQPIQLEKKLSEIDSEFIQKMITHSVHLGERIVYFCKDDFPDERVIEKILKSTSTIVGVKLLDCDSPHQLADSYLIDFLSRRFLDNKHKMVLVKYENAEHAVFDKEPNEPNLKEFVDKNHKLFLRPLTSKYISHIMENNIPAIFIFLENNSEKKLKDFKEVALKHSEEKKMLFFFSFVTKSKEKLTEIEYNSKYFRQILGITSTDVPCVRILHFTENHETKKYLPLSQDINEQSIEEFVISFKRNSLSNYKKTSLPESLTTLQLYSSYVENFNQNIFKPGPNQKNLFLFIYGDLFDCPECEAELSNFQSVIEEKIKANPSLQLKIRFAAANAMREELDDYIPNKLPILVYFSFGENSRAPQNFFFKKRDFGVMIDLVLTGQNLETNKSFLNINSADLDGDL